MAYTDDWWIWVIVAAVIFFAILVYFGGLPFFINFLGVVFRGVLSGGPV